MQEAYNREISQVKEILAAARNVVFFGGAGVSTDSGIPDFRGSGGLYSSQEDSNAYYLSRECLVNEPEQFYRFFRANMLFPDAKPNAAHKALAKLEKAGILKAVITQNIDGLHQKAGSQRVIELHGTANRYYCTRCRRVYGPDFVEGQAGVPVCTACGSLVRPDVTLYGEALDGFSFADAEQAVADADVFIVGGTSLLVHPAASLVNAYRGKHLIIINYSPTPYDGLAEFIIRASISDVLNQLTEER